MKTETQTELSLPQQAEQFAEKNGIKLAVMGHDYRKYFQQDKEKRHVFKLLLTRNKKRYTFTFGQSIANHGQEPTIYNVLSCLTKYDPGSFENFCGDFGYDQYSITAESTYKAVVKEWEAVQRLFGDILEELAEIQ